MRTIPFYFSLCLCALAMTWPLLATAQQGALMPNPKFSPEKVITIELEALKNNDKKDSGIEIVFRFASPENKKFTAPISRFKQMVKNPVYRPMLNYKSVQRGPLRMSEGKAIQNVIITAANGEKALYTFQLSKQKSGKYAGCWMSDAVIRAQPRPSTPPPANNTLWDRT